jgi:nicotinamidase-related amidase
MARALLVIDVQNEYFTGQLPITPGEPAIAVAHVSVMPGNLRARSRISSRLVLQHWTSR